MVHDPLHLLLSLGLLLLAAGLTWLAVRGGRMGREALCRLRALRWARELKVHDLSEGPVTLVGRVVARDPLRAPHSGRQAVWFEQLVERFSEQSAITNLAGLSGQWLAVDRREETAPFELEDREGRRIPVDPEGIQVDWPLSDPVPLPGQPGLRVSEAVLEPGEAVVVLGAVKARGGFEPDAAYRGTLYRKVLCASTDGLRITRLRGAARPLVGRILLGLLSLGLALLAWPLGLFLTANSLPWLRAELPGPVQMHSPRPERYDAYWGCTEDALPLGPGRVEVWVLGLAFERMALPRARAFLDAELWKRRQNCLHPEQIRRERRYLVVEVLVLSGTVKHRPAFFRAFCQHNPELCE